jgi:Sec-independent protein translocase protein TatA
LQYCHKALGKWIAMVKKSMTTRNEKKEEEKKKKRKKKAYSKRPSNQ